MKVYCDTCIYIDALDLNKENNDPIRPLKDLAWNFFSRVDAGEYILITSDWALEEFKKVIGSDKEIKGLIDGIQNKIHVTKTQGDINKAKALSQKNFPDALHVILAKKAGALILTTRNIQDFAEFQDLIDISLPESL
jgi:predicted nucleic acid-binding protein